MQVLMGNLQRSCVYVSSTEHMPMRLLVNEELCNAIEFHSTGPTNSLPSSNSKAMKVIFSVLMRWLTQRRPAHQKLVGQPYI